MNSLANGELAVVAITDFRKQFNHDDPLEIIATLRVDAFSMVPFEAKSRIDGASFLFVLSPLDSSERSILVRLHPDSHGSADKTIQNIIHEVLHILREMHVLVWFSCRDGDAGYSLPYRTHFLDWQSNLLVNGFEKTRIVLFEKRQVPSLDILHVLKNMLAQIVGHNVSLNPSCFETKTNATKLNILVRRCVGG
jgi:hypothetical protein